MNKIKILVIGAAALFVLTALIPSAMAKDPPREGPFSFPGGTGTGTGNGNDLGDYLDDPRDALDADDDDDSDNHKDPSEPY